MFFSCVFGCFDRVSVHPQEYPDLGVVSPLALLATEPRLVVRRAAALAGHSLTAGLGRRILHFLHDAEQHENLKQDHPRIFDLD
jgi:hypothetical protein